ncbi:Tetraspanin-7 [Merluccius polli]|uniref:Tetraspanin-7 n=1 Tax=Merluccius polli TaxID=89951 RepID=A0AA47NXB4_MERPO|nr:Tetraspanin-7 [Merluccius polli]
MIVVGFSSGYSNKHLILIQCNVYCQLDQYASTQGLLVLRGFGPVTVVMAVLGLCATAHTRPLLLLYSLVVLVVFVALMVVSAPLVQVLTQVELGMEDLFVNVTPLYRADVQLQTPLKEVQMSESCCGLKGFSDWREQLPVSCSCSPPDSASSSSSRTSFGGVAGGRRSAAVSHNAAPGEVSGCREEGSLLNLL